MSEVRSDGDYIVLAEDNPADVHLVREAFKEHNVGCELRVFSDGDAVAKFFSGLDADANCACPRLLLLDMHLPKLDGAEILSHIRATERCAQTPVVVLTSSEAPHDVATAVRHAALHYFQKPPSLDGFMRLGSLVNDVLSRGAAEGQHSAGA